RGSMAGICPPLPTLRRRPYGRQRTARGRCGSLHLHRSGLAPPTPCRSPGALRVLPPQPASPVSLAGGPPKSAQIGPIRRIRLSLRVPDRATKASFRLSVSEGHFWCLVFGRCGCSVKNSNERSRPPLSGECWLKRLVAGVSGHIFDECVTKCVAVLKQHGGFAPTVPSRRSKAG